MINILEITLGYLLQIFIKILNEILLIDLEWIVMLELPEVIIITKQMNEELVGKRIERIALDNYQGLVNQGFMKLTPEEYEKRLVGKTIKSIINEGKYFLVNFDPPEYLFFISFETSGNILYHKDLSTLPEKYTIKITFEDKTMLTVRVIAWGFILVETEEYFLNHKYISFRGLSPIDDELNFEKFNELLENHTKSIKTFFVGQKFIAGIGNGYLQDIFFKAKIHPKRKVSSLSREERQNLFTSMQSVMKEALTNGGRDSELNLYGEPGKYTPILDKRMKEKSCPLCGKIIEKQHVDGSTAYVCTNCQPL